MSNAADYLSNFTTIFTLGKLISTTLAPIYRILDHPYLVDDPETGVPHPTTFYDQWTCPSTEQFLRSHGCQLRTRITVTHYCIEDCTQPDRYVSSHHYGKNWKDTVLDQARQHLSTEHYRVFKRAYLEKNFYTEKNKENRQLEHRNNRRTEKQRLKQYCKELY